MNTPTPDPEQNRDSGAILVMTALSLVVLLGFVGLSVDLGLMWLERTNDQSAADAAVMAAAIEIANSNPTDEEIVAVAKAYVESNIGFPADDPGWATGCPSPTDDFLALTADTDCVSVKQTVTLSNDLLLKVRVPDQVLQTHFARFVGIDTMTVSAEAIARIEANPGAIGALPFAIPTGLNNGEEYCLGAPPAGHSRAPCDGGNSGNFGAINSPEFGAEDDPWGTTGPCDDGGPSNPRTERNIALGIDHFLRIAPDGADPDDGKDTCDAAETTPVEIPYALLARQGDITQLSDGFISSGPYGSLPVEGLLRQGPYTERILEGKNNNDHPLDDYGLWNFLVEPGDSSDPCHSSNFDEADGGPAITLAMQYCLYNGTVKFTDALLQSPRFGLAPIVDLNESELGDLSPSANFATNIVDFAPVFLQSMWFNCNATDCSTRFELPDGTWANNFDPGEGGISPSNGCSGNDTGCTNPEGEKTVEGITVFVLTDDNWMPDSFNNNFNEPGGFDVYLYR